MEDKVRHSLDNLTLYDSCELSDKFNPDQMLGMTGILFIFYSNWLSSTKGPSCLLCVVWSARKCHLCLLVKSCILYSQEFVRLDKKSSLECKLNSTHM